MTGAIASQTPTAQRLPASVLASIALHGALFAGWLYIGHSAKDGAKRVIGNVDLVIQPRRAALPAPRAAAKTAPSTMDFLKMALPAMPRVAPQRLEMKIPEAARRVPLAAAPKLADRGRITAGPKLEELDPGTRKVAMADVAAKADARRAAKLAALPRLEEVGRRRVSNLPQAMALEERRQEAVGLQNLNALNAAAERRGGPVMAPALQDAGGEAPAGRVAQTLAKMLPSQALDMRGGAGATPVGIPRPTVQAPTPAPRRQAGPQLGESKKGVEIEGPLADRKVVAYSIPEFPAWAREQGVLEASVAIRFWVSRQGDVLGNMRVERTSGYGRLDRLAIDSLKQWKFAPLATDEKQWGVITFRFILE